MEEKRKGFQKVGSLSVEKNGGLLLQLRSLARVNNFAWINGGTVELLFENAAVFADEEVHATRGFVLVNVNAVFASRVTAPVAEQRESNADGIGKSVIGERAIHAHTQNLGVGSFQLFQILLEVFHLLRSTTGKSEDVERKHDLLLAAILAESHIFEFVTIEI